MKLLFIFLCIGCCTISYGQNPCDKVELIDKRYVMNEKPLFNKLRKIETASIPSAVKEKMEESIKDITYSGFYNTLTVKAVRQYDSVIKRNSFSKESIYDYNENKEIDLLYVFHYETKLNQIPFIFRVDFKKNGELFSEEQLWDFQFKNDNIFNCEKITAIALADTIKAIKSVENICLYLSKEDKKIVWQVEGGLDAATQTSQVKIIDSYTGEILRREVFKKTYNDEPLIEIKIKGN